MTLLERRSEVGGRLQEKRLGEFRFDLGPSLLLMPDVYRATFAALGVEEPPEFVVPAPYYHAYFSGDEPETPPFVLDPRDSGFLASIEQLEPGGAVAFARYAASASANLEGGWPLFIEEALGRASELLPDFVKSAATLEGWPLQSHMRQLERLFPTSPRIRALLSFQDLYVGLSPYDAPAVFSLLQAIELGPRHEIHYPIGGFGEVTRVLQERLAALGVEVRTDAAVLGVDVRQGRAVGVCLVDEERILADCVVSNADVPTTEETLLPREAARSFDKAEFSSSVVSLSFALDRRFEALAHHTIVFADDLSRKPWDALFRQNPRDFDGATGHFYVHAPARTDCSAAPPGCDAITVLAPTPPLPRDATEAQLDALSRDWEAAARRHVVRRLKRLPGMAEFEDHIVDEHILGPRHWRRDLSLARGAVFGLSGGLNQLALLRPGRTHPNVEDLYFVGASSRPGNGVPLVMVGARLLAEDIIRSQSAKR